MNQSWRNHALKISSISSSFYSPSLLINDDYDYDDCTPQKKKHKRMAMGYTDCEFFALDWSLILTVIQPSTSLFHICTGEFFLCSLYLGPS